MILPPGGFLTLGFLLFGLGWWERRRRGRGRGCGVGRACPEGGMMGENSSGS